MRSLEGAGNGVRRLVTTERSRWVLSVFGAIAGTCGARAEPLVPRWARAGRCQPPTQGPHASERAPPAWVSHSPKLENPIHPLLHVLEGVLRMLGLIQLLFDMTVTTIRLTIELLTLAGRLLAFLFREVVVPTSRAAADSLVLLAGTIAERHSSRDEQRWSEHDDRQLQQWSNWGRS